MHRLSHIGRFALAAALAFCVPAHAQPARVPGTSVRMTPPPGFSAAEQFPGFVDAESGASIVITEIPGPAKEVRRGMTPQGLASRGMTLIESSEAAAGNDEALLLHVSQRAGGVDWFKWMLVGGTSERTFMIVGTFPADASDLSDPVRRAVSSATWSGDKRTDLYEGLTFHVETTPRMRLAERMGNLLIFTESGTFQTGKPGAAVLIVGSSMGAAKIDDLARYARERLMQTDRLKAVRVRRDSAVVVDGLNGREVIGEGSDAKDGRPVGVYQLLLADADGYYIAQGFVTRPRLEEMLPVFRKVTGSFRRVEPPRPTITQ